MYTSVRLRHVSTAPRQLSAHAMFPPAPRQRHTRTAHSVPVDTRSLRNNDLDPTTKASLKKATSANTGFTLEL